MKYQIILILILFPLFLMAQPTRLMSSFQDMAGNPYAYALAGGLNNPQFSEIDLDGDGDKDLICFDRVGFVVLPFLNGGTPNVEDYTYAPEYAYRFPKVEHWMLLRDYNCDGIEDLFAYKYDYNTGKVSITVYTAGRDAQNKIEFQLAKNILEYHLKGQTTMYNLFNSSFDLPAIDDIDGDNDLDILNFNSSGGYVEMFKNESAELGFGCDSLMYVYNDNCWGRIYESGVSEVIDLSPVIDSCPGYPNWNPIKRARHSGSTLMTYDADNDGDKELVLGDLSFTNLTLLTNGGKADTAHITHQEVFFPQNSVVVNIDVFPASFYVDVNNDGAKDLLAAPNIIGNSLDVKNWYYKNTGSANFPVFTYEKDDFLVDEMIDLGTNATPAFFDFNNDGKQDIVVGNYEMFISTSVQRSFLQLYENIGTATQPSFRLIDPNFGNLQQYNLPRMKPTFGDLDGDGDQDMLLGGEDGQLIYVPNQGTAAAPVFAGILPNYANIDVGQNSTPQLVDVDRDGDLDLIIGERNGNLNYYENTGTSSAASFSSTATNGFWGAIDTKLPGLLEGNSAPFLVDVGGVYHLFVGSEIGELWHYDHIDGNLSGSFTLVASVLDSIDEGEESVPAIANINNNGALEFLIGNKRGGLGLYTEYVLSPIDKIVKHPNQIKISPNPTSTSIEISFNDVINAEASLKVMNMLGQVVLFEQFWINQSRTQNLEQLAAGTYILSLKADGERYVEQVIIVK